MSIFDHQARCCDGWGWGDLYFPIVPAWERENPLRLVENQVLAYDRIEEKGCTLKLKVLIYAAEEGGYWAKVPAIPGCASQGETLEEVRVNILDALEGCLAVREELEAIDGPVLQELEV